MYYNETYPPPSDMAYGPEATCTLQTCSVVWSILSYRPSLPANALFLALFSVSLIGHVYQGWRYKTWFFAGAVICGCICEILGYAGRIILHDNPFSFTGFIMQIVIITLGPAFICAAIYVTLSQIILHLSPSTSRFPPAVFYYLFIPCDIISLVLQAAGGAISSLSIGRNEAGIACTLTGLSFQVFTLLLFMTLALDYAWRYARFRRGAGFSSGAGKECATDDPLTGRFIIFLSFLGLSTICIFIRCCYRIAELKDGYAGDLFHDEATFIGLESVMIVIATFALNVAQPAPVLGRPAGTSPRTASGEMEIAD